MSTLRERMLYVADKIRLRTAPGAWDYRTVKVQIIRRVWAGGETGADGGFVDTVLTDFPEAWRVSNLSTQLIASSGGRYELDDLKIGPITPAYVNVGGVSGGYTPAQLDPAPTVAVTGTEIIYRLTGTVQGDYRLGELHTERAVSYYLYLKRTHVTP